MANASKTIPISKETFSMMLMPKMGKLENNNGNNAQCIAQAMEVVIPRASQFTFRFIRGCKHNNYATELYDGDCYG